MSHEGIAVSGTVFTLASGRSGTQFLCGLLRRNAPGCVVMHEPYLQRGNPNLFGLPIYDQATGNLDAIRRLLEKKRATIDGYRTPLYVETSHAFLKSWWELAPEFFPQMKVLHLIRHPLEVARSEANRHAFIERWRLPLRHYRGRDGRQYFRWALTGREPIFGHFDGQRLTLFQRYLLQWIEIENRAMRFLDRFDMQRRCLTLHTPDDLNDARQILRLLRFLELPAVAEALTFPHAHNRTPGELTVVGAEELRQCRAVIEELPPDYIDIFRREPYAACRWSGLLRKAADCQSAVDAVSEVSLLLDPRSKSDSTFSPER